MKLLLSCLLLFLLKITYSQSYKDSIIDYQKELNKEYKTSFFSPLTKAAKDTFTSLDYFPINKLYSVEAKFSRITSLKPYIMKTTANTNQVFDVYGELIFEINGKEFKLFVYQSQLLKNMDKYKDQLFVPFTDLTNGNESYGGGRYIDLKIKEGDVYKIDFNKTYNPYCAYNPKQICPIPPKENHIDYKIEAGLGLYIRIK